MNAEAKTRKWHLSSLKKASQIHSHIKLLIRKFLIQKKQYVPPQYRPSAKDLTREELKSEETAFALNITKKKKKWDDIRAALIAAQEKEEKRMSTEKTNTEEEIAERNRLAGMQAKAARMLKFNTKKELYSREKRFQSFVEFASLKVLSALTGVTPEQMEEEFEAWFADALENENREQENEEVDEDEGSQGEERRDDERRASKGKEKVTSEDEMADGESYEEEQRRSVYFERKVESWQKKKERRTERAL